MTTEPVAADYTDIVLFLATAGVIVPILRRLKLSPVLAFLAIGALLGPFGLGSMQGLLPLLRYVTIADTATISRLGDFGVVFLLFSIGLELSWERLWTMRRLVFGLGSAQVVASAAALALAASLLSIDSTKAILLGMALALSSTAIVIPLLAEQRRQYSRAGRAVFAVLLLQDLAVAPILVTMVMVQRHQGEPFNANFLLAFVPSVLGLVVLVVLGRLVLRPMMRSVARFGSEGLFVAASLLIVLVSGLLAAVSGLSMALGSFIAGLLLAETEYRKQIEKTVEPFKVLLLGLFFMSIGADLDLSLLIDRPLLIVGILTGLLLLKGVVALALCRSFGLSLMPALEVSLLLAAAGEFAFVVLHGAVSGGLIDRRLAQSVLVSCTLSMFCIPILATIGAWASRRGARQPQQPSGSIALQAPGVLVIGFGLVGRFIGEILSRQHIPWMAVEKSPRLVEAARKDGHEVYYGDAQQLHLLERFGIDRTLAVVVTMNSADSAEELVAMVRSFRPDVPIVARARDSQQAARLYGLGATDVIVEAIETSLQISEAVLTRVGAPPSRIAADIRKRREEFHKQAIGSARSPKERF